MKYLRVIISLLVLVLSNQVLLSQTDTAKIDYDKTIKIAIDLTRQMRYDDARLLAQRILKDVPEYVDARLIVANTLAYQGFADEAREEYYRIFEYDNANKEAFLALIRLEIGQGKPEVGAELAMKALDFYSDDIDLLLSYARASQLAGDYIDAKKGILAVLEKDPENADARGLYDRLNTTIPVSNNGVIFPGLVGPFDILSIEELYIQAKGFAVNMQYFEARTLCNQILFFRPDFFPARILIAQTYAWGNDFEPARDQLKKINVEETGNRDGILCWIDVEKWARNYSQALYYCNLGIKFYRYDEEFYIKKSEVYEAAGNLFDAKMTLFGFLAGHPGNVRFTQQYQKLVDKSNILEIEAKKPVRTDTVQLAQPIDTLLAEARNLAYDGEYDSANEICMEVLRVQPKNFGAKLLLGNIAAWKGEYSKSLDILEPLIKESFDDRDLINSLIDTEIWYEDFDGAGIWVKYGLDIYPGDPDLLYRQAMVYQRNGNLDLANATLKKLIARYPKNKDYVKAYYAVKGPLKINGISAEFTYNKYTQPVNRSWNMYSLKYYNSNKIGTFIGAVNTGWVGTDTSGFMKNSGVQFEVDAYPVFKKQKTYFHLNLGLSPSTIFARQRVGIHVYKEITSGWELSAGFNYMRYRDLTDTTNVFIANLGVSKYFGSTMISGGFILSPANGKVSQGYNVTFRQYLRTAEDWIQLTLGTGRFPDNPLYYLNDPKYDSTAMLRSINVLFAANFRITPRFMGRVYAGYQNEEYRQTFFRNSPTINLAAIYLFKD
jgi:YaiO family outer membrane protein